MLHASSYVARRHMPSARTTSVRLYFSLAIPSTRHRSSNDTIARARPSRSSFGRGLEPRVGHNLSASSDVARSQRASYLEIAAGGVQYNRGGVGGRASGNKATLSHCTCVQPHGLQAIINVNVG